MATVQVVISHPDVVGKRLEDIRLAERIGALPLEVRRHRTVLPLSSELELHRGDVMTGYGPELAIDAMVAMQRQLMTTQRAAQTAGDARLRLRTITGPGMLVDREAIKRRRVVSCAAFPQLTASVEARPCARSSR